MNLDRIISKLVIASLFLLIGLTACKDDPVEDILSTNISDKIEILRITRGCNNYTLEIDETGEWYVRSEGGFFFLSDSTGIGPSEINIEIEQNPLDEVRFGKINIYSKGGFLLRSVSIEQVGRKSQNDAKAYAEALQRSYGVGYGYDAFGEYAGYSSVRDQVINLVALRRYEQASQVSLLYDDFATEVEQVVFEGKDSEALSKSMAIQAGLSADLLLFQAELSIGYSESSMKTSGFSFCTIMNKVKRVSRHLEPFDLSAVSRQDSTILTYGFRQACKKIKESTNSEAETKAINELLDIYGTHTIYHAELGGRLNYHSSVEQKVLVNGTTLSMAAKVGFAHMLGYSVEQTENIVYEQTKDAMSTTVFAKGGDVTLISDILYQDTDDNDFQLPQKKIEDWYTSVKWDTDNPTESNAELIDFKLIPIYELIRDEEVRAKVIYRLTGRMDDKAIDFPRPVPQYYRLSFKDLLNHQDYRNNLNRRISAANKEIIADVYRENIVENELYCIYPVINSKLDMMNGFALHVAYNTEEWTNEVSRRNISDSLYSISWQGLEYTMKAIYQIKDINSAEIYYNDGEWSIQPLANVQYENAQIVNPINSMIKAGPYILQGDYSPDLLQYEALSLDWRLANWKEDAVNFEKLQKKYHVFSHAEYFLHNILFFGKEQGLDYDFNNNKWIRAGGKEYTWRYILIRDEGKYSYDFYL